MKKLLLSVATLTIASGMVVAQTAQQDNPDALTLKSSSQVSSGAPPSDAMILGELRQSGSNGRAVVSFDRRLNDNQVRQILEKAGVRPFAVLMQFEGMNGAHQVPENKASLDIVDAARSRTVTMQDRAIKGAKAKAKAFTTTIGENTNTVGGDDETGQAILAGVEQSEKLKQGLARGQPAIYAAYVIGTADQLDALKSAAQVTSVALGYTVNSRLVLPAAVVPADAKSRFEASAATKLRGAPLKAKLVELGAAQ